MEYLVMETHPAYAVVLDINGAFRKVANLGYRVGDRVTDVVVMKPAPSGVGLKKSLAVFAAAAACFCILFFGAYKPNYMAYGTVRMTINPDVLMTVSRTDRVIKLAGINSDGRTLISGYDFKGKSEDAVAAALMNRASQMGYLKDNGKVKLNISSKSSTWVSDMETDLSKSMDDGVSGKDVTIFLYLNGGKTPDMVIVTGSGSPKTYSYADWQAAQTAKSSGGTQSAQTPGSIEQWGENQGDAWEQWGEEQGDSWESFGNDVEDIFDDGFSGGNDVSSFINRLKDQLG